MWQFLIALFYLISKAPDTKTGFQLAAWYNKSTHNEDILGVSDKSLFFFLCIWSAYQSPLMTGKRSTLAFQAVARKRSACFSRGRTYTLVISAVH